MGVLCMQSIKEHNLKANHNKYASQMNLYESVCNLSKNTIWKQITTGSGNAKPLEILYAIYQRTQSESKSQQKANWRKVLIVCMQSIKEHNLKANHNGTYRFDCDFGSVCNLSKNTIWKQITTTANRYGTPASLYAIYQRTQSESKSQQ